MAKWPNVTIEGVKGRQSDSKAYGTTAYGTTCRRQKGRGLLILKWYGMSSYESSADVAACTQWSVSRENVASKKSVKNGKLKNLKKIFNF
jgi:hypothetical protein